MSTQFSAEGEYENYSTTSKCYNRTRGTPGIDILIGALSQLKRPLSELTILEAGSGTGNYLHRLKGIVGKCVGLDINQGMINECKSRIEEGDRIELVQGSIMQMPFKDQTFDCVYSCMVLHHLGGLEGISRFIEEAHRVLNPGGCIVLNFTGPEQLESFWYLSLIPRARKEIGLKCPSPESIRSLLCSTGFNNVRQYMLPETLQVEEQYLLPQNVLDSTFRSGDSTWALATPEEVRSAEDQVRGWLQNNEGAIQVANRDSKRMRLGQSTTIVALKPAQAQAPEQSERTLL